ncbi:MAG: trypsin-like serine protease [Polyangiaceae bacterium]
MTRRLLWLALSAASTALCGCGPTSGQAAIQEASAAIIDGIPASPGDFPNTGALVVQGEIWCTGTLIAPSVVLTAAHCIQQNELPGGQPPSFTLALDVTDAYSAGIYQGTDMLAHEDYDPNAWYGANDIGLVFLAEHPAGATHELLPSPAVGASIGVGADVDIAGYGQTDENIYESAGVLYKAHTELTAVGQRDITIGGPNQPQGCYGDSGGPSFLPVAGGRRVIGVVSAGVGDGCSDGEIHTRVDPFLGWIHAHADVPCDSGLSDPCNGSSSSGTGGSASSGVGAGSSVSAGAGGDPSDGGDDGTFDDDADDDGSSNGEDHDRDADASSGCSGAPGPVGPSGAAGVALALLTLLGVRRRRDRGAA